jgi:hypothetical protein
VDLEVAHCWLVWVSYKLCMFAWLVIYQRLPSKVLLVKSGLCDGLCPICNRFEIVKHMLWDC